MDELNKFSKRFKRYADLGTSAGSLAINFLGSKIFNSKDGKNISRTMLRMSNNAEILSTAKYGYYKLPTEEDLNHNHY